MFYRKMCICIMDCPIITKTIDDMLDPAMTIKYTETRYQLVL